MTSGTDVLGRMENSEPVETLQKKDLENMNDHADIGRMENTEPDATSVKNDSEIAVDVDACRKGPVRVIMWTAPRSLSTAFARCMTEVPNSKIFIELYGAAFTLGPERKVQWYPNFIPGFTYQYCKDRLEADHSNYDFVFVKDFVFEMHLHADKLPKGYQHVFLMRHPYKVFTSLRRMLCRSLILRMVSRNARIKICIPSKGYFYEDMWELYSYLRDHPDYPDPIIIDADDLLSDPEAMIRKYCDLIGIPFHQDMLTWEKAKLTDMPWERPGFFRLINWMIKCYENALKSEGFWKGGSKKNATKNGACKTEDGTTSATDFSEAVHTDSSLEKASEDLALDSKQTQIHVDMVGVEAINATGDDGPLGERINNESSANENASEGDVPNYASGDRPSSEHGNGDVRFSVTEYDLSNLHSDIRKAIEYTMPFYKLLYEQRIIL